MIRRHYDHLEVLEKEITALEAEIEDLLSPYQKEIELLDTIPGINKDAAASILSEVGPDMSVFPSEGHLASWGGNNESAGKKKVCEPVKGIKAKSLYYVRLLGLLPKQKTRDYPPFIPDWSSGEGRKKQI